MEGFARNPGKRGMGFCEIPVGVIWGTVKAGAGYMRLSMLGKWHWKQNGFLLYDSFSGKLP